MYVRDKKTQPYHIAPRDVTTLCGVPPLKKQWYYHRQDEPDGPNEGRVCNNCRRLALIEMGEPTIPPWPTGYTISMPHVSHKFRSV